MLDRTKHFYDFGRFRIDIGDRLLLRDGETVPLTPKVFDILLMLAENSGRIVEKEELMKAVWPDSFVEESNITQAIYTLRRVLAGGSTGDQWIETLPRRGYRFKVIAKEVVAEPAPLVVEESTRSQVVVEEEIDEEGTRESEAAPKLRSDEGSRWPRRVKWILSLSVLLTVLLISGVAYVWFLRPAEVEAPPALRSLAVLPFQPVGSEGANEYLGLAVADALITKLSHLGQIAVRPTSAILRYSQPPQGLAVGRELKVDSLLEGTFRTSRERVRVTVQLVNVREGSPVWAEKFDEKLTDLFTLEDTISERVAEALALKLTGQEKKLLSKRYTDNAAAYQLYVKGVFFRNQMTKEGLNKSIECFQQATEIDPNYALAYAGQAGSYSPLGYIYVGNKQVRPRILALVTRALELDDTLAEAHAALGEYKTYFEWEWQGAEREFRRAIELNPNYHLAHHLYANLLNAMGRSKEGIAQRRRALEIDPFSTRSNLGLGNDLYWIGEYDQALRQLRQAQDFGHPSVNLGPIYEKKGMLDEAAAEHIDFEKRRGASAEALAAMKSGYDTSGWTGFWEVQLKEAQDRSRREYFSPVNLALCYVRLNRAAEAIQQLERAYEDRDPRLIDLRVVPEFASLHSDRRFRNLLRRMGLSE